MKQKFSINRLAAAFLSLLLCVILSSCNTKLNGKYLKDSDGNIYQAEWRIGGCYLLNKVDLSGIDSVRTK